MARIKPQALLQQSKKKKAPGRISLTKIVFFSLIGLLALYCVVSTFRYLSYRSVNQGDKAYYTGRRGLGNLKDHDVPRYAILKTSKGMITVEFLKDNSPESVDEFINLCENGNFKGMQFHRVMKDFIIQAGDVHSLGVAEEWISRGKQHSGLDRSMNHEAFMLGTSKRKPNKKGFELYITTAPIPDLNELTKNSMCLDKLLKESKLSRFIQAVVKLGEIEEVDTDEQYQPKSPIQILDVTLEHTI